MNLADLSKLFRDAGKTPNERGPTGPRPKPTPPPPCKGWPKRDHRPFTNYGPNLKRSPVDTGRFRATLPRLPELSKEMLAAVLRAACALVDQEGMTWDAAIVRIVRNTTEDLERAANYAVRAQLLSGSFHSTHPIKVMRAAIDRLERPPNGGLWAKLTTIDGCTRMIEVEDPAPETIIVPCIPRIDAHSFPEEQIQPIPLHQRHYRYQQRINRWTVEYLEARMP